MKYLFPFCLLFLTATFCTGQIMDTCKLSPLPSNSIFVELAGNATFLGSLNYERKIFNKNTFYLTGRAGFGYGRFFGYSMLSAPITITATVRVFRRISYELGVGATLMRIGNLISESNSHVSYKNDIAPTALVGIRFQANNGFLFRFDFTPIYAQFKNTDLRKNVYPFFGVSFGYSFGIK